MKILTLLGTRPEIIRLSRVIPLLDHVVGRENHCLVHTGQNHDESLSQVFFDELGLRAPDFQLEMRGTFAKQIASVFPALERLMTATRPDRLLVLGDTNSSLAAIVAARLQIPVYHMEAGNRSFSPSSPEEVNRRLIDHCSTVLLPYTERSRGNLLAEGIHSSRIMVTGNPIHEVIDYYGRQIDLAAEKVRERLGLTAGKFFLVTLHRAENVDDRDRLQKFLSALNWIQREYKIPVIVSAHPHLRVRMAELRDRLDQPNRIESGCYNPKVQFLDPFPFFDFLSLTRSARCVLSDSGTVQEECAILHVPLICLRDYTERPETVEAGATVLSGADPAAILAAVRLVTEGRPDWTVPGEYVRPNVAKTVVRILLSHKEGQPAQCL